MTKLTMEQIIAKWTPLTLGVEEDKIPRLSWALEQEAAFLKSLTRSTREDSLGENLKLVFPVIRRAVEYLGEDEIEIGEVYNAVSAAAQSVTEAAVEIDPGDSVCVESQTKFVADLSDRLCAALATFPG